MDKDEHNQAKRQARTVAKVLRTPRYRPRVVRDRKREASRKACRKPQSD